MPIKCWQRKCRQPLLPETNMGTIYQRYFEKYFFYAERKLTSKEEKSHNGLFTTISCNCSHIGSVSSICVWCLTRSWKSKDDHLSRSQPLYLLHHHYQWRKVTKYSSTVWVQFCGSLFKYFHFLQFKRNVFTWLHLFNQFSYFSD